MPTGVDSSEPPESDLLLPLANVGVCEAFLSNVQGLIYVLITDPDPKLDVSNRTIQYQVV